MTYRKTRNVSLSEYQRCADAGMSVSEAARELNVDRLTVYRKARAEGVFFSDGRQTPRSVSRNQEIKRCADAGMSMAETSRKLRLPASTIRTAAKRHHIVFVSGNQKETAKRRKDGQRRETTNPNAVARVEGGYVGTAPVFLLDREPSDNFIRAFRRCLDQYAQVENAAMRKRGQGMTHAG